MTRPPVQNDAGRKPHSENAAMQSEFIIGEKLPDLVERIVASYKADERTHHINRSSAL